MVLVVIFILLMFRCNSRCPPLSALYESSPKLLLSMILVSNNRQPTSLVLSLV